jgi:acetolactate synthase-1/2/3 large subunit
MEQNQAQTVTEKERMTTKRIKGSDAVLLSLLEEQVDTIFGYPGGAIMPVYDALMKYDKQINHILTRHEQGAIHAAQGYARVTGKVGVCMVTSGPGATNLITGIADAMIDSTPVVCISGQVAAHLLGSDAFQETDVVGITMPVTKWNILVTKPEEIPGAIAQAFYLAQSGRPGPVVIDIAKNAQFGELDYKYQKCQYLRSYRPKPDVDTSQIEKAAQLINNAKKPYALVGQGVILGQAEEELKQFLEKSGIPFGWTILGLSAMPSDHPLNMGMLGMHGNYGPNIKTNECDVLIGIGMRFDDRVTGDLSRYAKQAKVVHLELDPAEVSKNVKADAPVIGNVKDSLPLLTDKVNKNSHEKWIEEFRECDKIEYEKVMKTELFPEKEGLTMAEVVRRLTEQTKGDAILVTDVGQHQMIASRYFKFNKSRSNVTSGGLGTMGFGLPAAFGAKVGKPNREVIAIIGDGGFQMTMQELATIVQTNAAVKIVILNNHFLGMVRQWQQLFFEKRYSFTRILGPDFIKLADAFGINGNRVDSREKLDEGISDMLNHQGPYLLEVSIEKEDNVFPMVPTGASVAEILLSPEG